MSLVKCPDCNRPISKRAVVCPGCGGPIPESLRKKELSSFSVFIALAGAAIALICWKIYQYSYPSEIVAPMARVSSAAPGIATAPSTNEITDESDVGPPPIWHQVDAYDPTGRDPHFVLTTDARSAAGFRKIVAYYKGRLGYGSEGTAIGLDIHLFPEGQSPPGKIAGYLAGNPHEDSWDDFELARYSCNNTNGWESLEIYIDRNRPIPVSIGWATELLAQNDPKLFHAVVRVDSAANDHLSEVAAYYDRVYNRPNDMVIYFTTTLEKWPKYPRVFPAEVPPQISVVFCREHEHVRIVEGSKFH